VGSSKICIFHEISRVSYLLIFLYVFLANKLKKKEYLNQQDTVLGSKCGKKANFGVSARVEIW
jgi:hypothetical protein